MADPLSNLGNVLMGAAQDYAQNKRFTEREALQREQRLADVAEARQYDTSVRNDQRAFTVAMQDKSIQDDMKRMLIHEGYDVSTPEKLAEAIADSQARGLDKRYQELMTTMGDDGLPLLSRADLKDGAKIEAAKQKLATKQGTARKFLDDQIPAASREANRLLGAQGKIQGKLDKLTQTLEEPELPPDPEAVFTKAVSNLKARNPDKKYQPSKVDVQAEIEAIMPAMLEDAQKKQFNKKQIAAVQANIMSTQLKDIAADLRSIRSQFPVVGELPAEQLTEPAAPAPSAPKVSYEEALKNFFDKVKPEPAPAPEPVGGRSVADGGGVLSVIGGALNRGFGYDEFTPPPLQGSVGGRMIEQQVNSDALKRFFVGGPSRFDEPTPITAAPPPPSVTAAPPAPQWIDSPITAAPPISPLNLLLSEIQTTDQQIATSQQPDVRAGLQRRAAALKSEYEKMRAQLLGPQASVMPASTNTSVAVQPFTPGAMLAPVN